MIRGLLRQTQGATAIREHDPEIEELRAKVHCAVVLERTPPTWKLDRKESTKLSLKYRRGEGGILIVSPPGSAWFADRNDAGAVTHVDIRGPAYKGSLTAGAKSLFRLPPEGPALPRLVGAEASIDALRVAAIENVRADTLYAATGDGMGPGATAALISASIQHAEHLAVSEHDCVRGRQALGDAAGFIHAAAGRAAPQGVARPTREAAGNTNGRSFSDCDGSCPIGYSATQALGTRADDDERLPPICPCNASQSRFHSRYPS